MLAGCGELAELGVGDGGARAPKSARADAATAVFLAAGAARSAAWAIRIESARTSRRTRSSPESSRAAAGKLAAVEEAERLAGRLLESSRVRLRPR